MFCYTKHKENLQDQELQYEYWRAIKRSPECYFYLFKALVSVYIVQPGQSIVIQDQSCGVKDQLRCCSRQLLQTLTREIQSVRIGAWALDTGNALLSGHHANLNRNSC